MTQANRYDTNPDNPQITETRRLSHSARNKMLHSQTHRVQQQQHRQTALEEGQRPTYYAGGGQIRTLGAETAMRPRSYLGNGGLKIGEAVNNNQGVVSGPPAGQTDFSEDVKSIQKRMSEVDYTAGAQLCEDDPNDIDGEGAKAIPLRPQALLFSKKNKSLYVWGEIQTEEGELVTEWLLIANKREELNGGIANPFIDNYPLIPSAIYRRRIDSLHTAWETTPGVAALAVNGNPVTPGETVLEVGQRLTLNVSQVGEGRLEFTVGMTWE